MALTLFRFPHQRLSPSLSTDAQLPTAADGASYSSPEGSQRDTKNHCFSVARIALSVVLVLQQARLKKKRRDIRWCEIHSAGPGKFSVTLDVFKTTVTQSNALIQHIEVKSNVKW